MGDYKGIQFESNTDGNYQYIAENELIEIDSKRIQRLEVGIILVLLVFRK